jgi:hypothetical protein
MNTMTLPTVPRVRRSPEALRLVLGVVLAFAALNAFGGGVYGITGAPGVPVEWLEGTPFSSYFVPSVILFVVVGGAFLFAAVAVFARARFASRAAVAAAVIVLGWIGVQVALLGSVSWMQPVTAVTGILILVLVWLLPAEG